jgi:hypothetical protein
MPTIAGLRGTGDWATDERPKNFRESILFLDPNGEAPLTALLSKMASESVDDPEFAWWEERNDHVRLQVNGALIDSATTMVVDAEAAPLSGALSLVAGDLLLVDSTSGQGEIVEVTANPTTDTSLTIARGVAGSTAAAIADNAQITKIGNAFEEGSPAPKATNKNPTKVKNYCQIFKTTYDITETAVRTTVRTGDPLKNDKKRKMFAHARDMEMAFLFGRAFETTGTNGKPKRYTAGLNSFITTNRTVFSGGTPFTEDNFITAIAPMFDRRGEGAGDERIGFVGNSGLTALNKLARTSSSTRVNFDGVVKTYGMNLQRWILPQGSVYLRTHPLMNTHPVFKSSAFFINPKGMTYRYLRDTAMKDNIQPPDEDHRKGQWLTECGLEVHHESTMTYLGNMA